MANWQSQSGGMTGGPGSHIGAGPAMDEDAHAHLVSALQDEIARQEKAFPDVLDEVGVINMQLQMGTPQSAELMNNISKMRSDGFLVGMNPETLATKIESGDEAYSGYLSTALERWNPAYRGDDPRINQFQDRIMSSDGYGGKGWLPHELEARNGVVGSYEPSPGGAVRNQLDARSKYLTNHIEGNDNLPSYQDYQSASEPYNPYALGNMFPFPDWSHDNLSQELFNPENILGSLLTKTQMGFIPEGASFAGDQMQGADVGMNPFDAATTRSYNSDVMRTYPQQTFDHGWRANDDHTNEMRKSFMDSESQSSGDFVKRGFGRVGMEYAPNVISDMTVNPFLTVANGFTDFTFGALDDIVFDGVFGGGVGALGESKGYYDKGDAFPQHVPYKDDLPRLKEQDKTRRDGLNNLHNNADKVVHHTPFGDDLEHDAMLALEMAQNAWSGAQDSIAKTIQPVVGAVDQGLTKAQKIASKAMNAYQHSPNHLFLRDQPTDVASK